MDVAVVGAGPYGLAVAAHLGARKVPFRIFGRPMDAWLRNMPKGMFLKSEGRGSSISSPRDAFTLERFCDQASRPYGDYGEPIPIDTFAEYGLAFQQALVPNLEQTHVLALSRQSEGFQLQLASGEAATAKKVVIATGFVPHRHVPRELRRLPDRLVTHTADHRDFACFAGRTVAVVGAGQSALETAALLLENGARPRVLVRNPTLVWNRTPDPWPRPLRTRLRAPIGGLGAGWRTWIYSELPDAVRRLPYQRRAEIGWGAFGPAGGWWLKERVDGLVDVLLEHRVIGAEEDSGGVALEVETSRGSTRVYADHAIAATGYRFSLDAIEFLDPELRARIIAVDGAPKLSSSFESSLSGLHFVGMAATPTYGPVMRFVCGTHFAAPRVAGALARASRHRTLRSRTVGSMRLLARRP
jgi:FAD-dependent urate hydroxylase